MPGPLDDLLGLPPLDLGETMTPQAPAPAAPSARARAKEYAPLLALLPIIAAKGGPQGVAALLHGFQQSRQQKAQTERQTQQDAERQRQTAEAERLRRATLAQNTANDAAQRRQGVLTQFQSGLDGLDSEEAVRAYLQLYGPQAQSVGLRPETLEGFAMQAVTPSRLQKKEATTVLEAAKKQYGEQAVSHTYTLKDGTQANWDELNRRAGVTLGTSAPETPDLSKSSLDVQAAAALAAGDMPTYARLKRVADEMSGARRPDTGIADINKQIAQLRLETLQRQGGVNAVAMTPAQERTARVISDDYDKASKDFIVRVQAFQTIDAAAKSPTAAGDLALIFAFMKMLDPGSTVREGEFANAQNSAGIPDRILNLYNKSLTGERLNTRQRGDFVNQARDQMEQARRRQRGLMDIYRSRARGMGVPEQYAVIDYEQAFGVTPQDQATAPQPAAPQPSSTARESLPEGDALMPDPVADILRTVQTSDRLRAAAWDAAYASDDPDQVAERLRALPIGDSARAKLWDARFAAPETAPLSEQAKIDAASVLPPTATAGEVAIDMLKTPLRAAKGAAQAASTIINKYGELGPHEVVEGLRDVGQGNLAKGAHRIIGGTAVTAAPMIAPALLGAAAAAPLATATTLATGTLGQQIGSRGASALGATPDQSALAGDVLGMAGGWGGQQLASAVERRAAPALQVQAQKKVEQALGPTKERFKAMTRRITPEILKRGLGGSRASLLAQAEEAADVAGSQIDDAIAQFGARSADTTPIVQALETAKDAFRTTSVQGTTVVFEPRAVKQLDGLQQIVSDLGPNASVEQLVAVRRAWDKVVDQAGGFAHRAGGAIGVPLQDQSEAWAKREATSAIRKVLDAEVPELSALNKEFSFWKTLQDVLTQTQQRTTPQQGGVRKAVTEVAGAAAGSSHGLGAAWATGKLAGVLNQVVTSPRWRLIDARLRDRLATALASGSSAQVDRTLRTLVPLTAPAAGALTRGVPNLASADPRESTR